jgi:ASC-1-like (ASCH) protein
LKANDVVTWVNDDMGFRRSLRTEVTRVTRFTTIFEGIYGRDACVKTLPAIITTIAKGVKVYRRFYDKHAEAEHGVVAFQVRLLLIKDFDNFVCPELRFCNCPRPCKCESQLTSSTVVGCPRRMPTHIYRRQHVSSSSTLTERTLVE